MYEVLLASLPEDAEEVRVLWRGLLHDKDSSEVLLKGCVRKVVNKMPRDRQRKHNIGDITRDGMRLYKYLHKGRCIYWTGQMLSNLRRLYPTNINAEVAEILGVGVRTMMRKAKELGIEKDPRWLKRLQAQQALENSSELRKKKRRALYERKEASIA